MLTLEFLINSIALRSYGAKPATSRTTLLTVATRWLVFPLRLEGLGFSTRRSVTWPRLIPQARPVED